jgi:hypothetical protein
MIERRALGLCFGFSGSRVEGAVVAIVALEFVAQDEAGIKKNNYLSIVKLGVAMFGCMTTCRRFNIACTNCCMNVNFEEVPHHPSGGCLRITNVK